MSKKDKKNLPNGVLLVNEALTKILDIRNNLISKFKYAPDIQIVASSMISVSNPDINELILHICESFTIQSGESKNVSLRLSREALNKCNNLRDQMATKLSFRPNQQMTVNALILLYQNDNSEVESKIRKTFLAEIERLKLSTSSTNIFPLNTSPSIASSLAQ